MRLAKNQQKFLKSAILAFAPEAKVYLFGSRTDNKKKGGDIDILILTDKTLSLTQKREIKLAFYQKFGEQKIDLASFKKTANDPFKSLALSEGIEL